MKPLKKALVARGISKYGDLVNKRIDPQWKIDQLTKEVQKAMLDNDLETVARLNQKIAFLRRKVC